MSIRSLTQEDPIGLAGGLNLYGFAAGDPVNFSDPFGLCPWHDIECWEDKMWAASGGSGFAGRVLAPLGSTALELTGLSSVDRGAKDAAGGRALAMGGLILDLGSSAVPGGRQGKAAVRELIRHATGGERGKARERLLDFVGHDKQLEQSRAAPVTRLPACETSAAAVECDVACRALRQ